MSVPEGAVAIEEPAETAETVAEEHSDEREPAAEHAAEDDREEIEDAAEEQEQPETAATVDDSPAQSEPESDAEDQPASTSIEDALEAQREAIAEDADVVAEDPEREATAEAESEDEVPVDAAPEDHAPETASEDPPRREVDAAVLGILREEAEREVAARRQERGEPLETQTEMGLAEAAPEPPATAEDDAIRVAEDQLDEAADGPGSRSDLLPDVEEINSTLRPADQHEDGVGPDDPVAQEMNNRRGFRAGFVAIIAVAAVLVLAYVFASQIVQAVPAAEPIVIIYLDVADSARAGLDSAMARSVEGLSDLLANMGGEEAN